jgi:hypothetical protein
MTKLSFPIEAGVLIRSQVRNHLHKMKSDIEWKIDNSIVSIDEVKNFLSSTFYVTINNIDEAEAKVIKHSIEYWVESNQ